MLRFRLDMMELTLLPAPPRDPRATRGPRMREVSLEVARESEARLGFSGVSSF